MIDVPQVLEVLDAPVVPFHQEDAGHEAVGDEDADAGEVVFPEQPPQGLIEAADPVVGIRSRLPVGDPVEEVPVVCPLLPHALHLGGTWLEVAKVLLAQPGLLVHLDGVSGKR